MSLATSEHVATSGSPSPSRGATHRRAASRATASRATASRATASRAVASRGAKTVPGSRAMPPDLAPAPYSPYHPDETRGTGTYGPQALPQFETDTGSASVPDKSIGTSARRARHHRPLRLNAMATFTIVMVVGLLTALIWLHGRALAASHLAAEKDAQIAEIRNELASTQEKIASYDASPRIAQWANERGWRLATQADFDDVTQNTALPAGGTDRNPASTLNEETDASSDAAPAGGETP